MRHFLRTIIWLGIIMLALSVTALSCNKGDKSNSGNNSSGGGGGGGDNTPKPSTPVIVITNLVAGKAKLGPKTNDGGKEYDTILINIEGFNNLTALLVNNGDPLLSAFADGLPGNSDNTTTDKIFDLTITGGIVGDTPASAGLVLVNKGNVAKAQDFVVPAPGGTATGSGIYVKPPSGAAANMPMYNPAGMNFFGIFADMADTTAANVDPNVDHFSFSSYLFLAFLPGRKITPAISCRSAVSTITSTTAGDPGVAAPATELTGGQTSTCYFGGRGFVFDAPGARKWLNNAAAATDWKSAFYISVAGIRTDKKALSDVLAGFTGTPDAKVAEFMNGLTQDEMAKLVANNVVAYKKILLKIVSGTEYANAPDVNGVVPTLPTATVTIDGFDAGVRLEGDTIQIKASAFPAVAAGNGAATLADLASAPANSLKKAFDIKITGGDRDPANATTPSGGLVLVGTGDKTVIGDFAITKNMFSAVPTTFKEGHTTGEPATAAGTRAEYQERGWNIYGAFMNDAVPASQSATTTPFAFSETTSGHPSQPFLFCRSTAGQYRSTTIDYNGDLSGGETATCYIGSKGTALNDATNPQATTWLNSNFANFKKTFNISIGAIRTDTDPVHQIGVGATFTAKTTSFADGLSKAELENIDSRYPTGVRTISVTIVEDTAF